jgi:hypothetical protein
MQLAMRGQTFEFDSDDPLQQLPVLDLGLE